MTRQENAMMNEKIESECRGLWKACFGDSEAYMDYYFGEKCRDNQILIDREDDRVVSMVHLNPYRLRRQGREIKSYYIVGVATEEKFRKQGRMRKLLSQAFSQMAGEQIPFAFLMPADKGIYEPFGFRTIYSQERILVKGIAGAEGASEVKGIAGARGTDGAEGIAGTKKEPEGELEAAGLKRTAYAGSPLASEASSEALSMKSFWQLTEQEKGKVLAYCDRKLSEEFDIYAVRDGEYYSRLQKEMEASGGNVAVFFEGQAAPGSAGEVAGVVPYCAEEGYVEVVEGLIEASHTKEIVLGLIWQEGVEEKDKIYFYESHFLDKEDLRWLGKEMEIAHKEIIMAKVLEENKAFEDIFGGQRVYLNEIV